MSVNLNGDAQTARGPAWASCLHDRSDSRMIVSAVWLLAGKGKYHRSLGDSQGLYRVCEKLRRLCYIVTNRKNISLE